jgi:hypothetical protein
MNMNSILVLIETPKSGGANREQQSEWTQLLGSLKDSAKTAKGVVVLADNLWQIDVHKQMPFLVELLNGLKNIPHQGLRYKFLQLEEGQIWISPPDA